MAGSVMVVKNILEDLIGKCLKSQYFKTGDGLAREVGRNIRMPVKFETDVETMAWHDSKSGAENLADWKWFDEVCYRSAVDKNLYRQLVKKSFSIVDVETSCRICKKVVDLEELWDHVERCVEVRCINYWYDRQRTDTKQCQYCKQ
ncbi:unnamed protein product [Brachionus calyciflorus]|uniref:Uncharacterized protein n=1 Tax=Brachionus calyciflorus TaxID=104777 RepID=A0A814AHH1_9BILA|nr:unnamed protein product [Brachionus calyciflorus]